MMYVFHVGITPDARDVTGWSCIACAHRVLDVRDGLLFVRAGCHHRCDGPEDSARIGLRVEHLPFGAEPCVPVTSYGIEDPTGCGPFFIDTTSPHFAEAEGRVRYQDGRARRNTRAPAPPVP